MSSGEQVYEFMHHNVFEAIRRLLRQFEINPNAPRFGTYNDRKYQSVARLGA